MFELKEAVVQSVHAALIPHEGNSPSTKAQSSRFEHLWSTWLSWFQLRPGKQPPKENQPLAEPLMSSAAREAEKAVADKSVMVALHAVGQYLSASGLELGKDFSYGDGSLILNDLAFSQLRQKLGPDQFDQIMQTAPGLFQPNHQTAIQALEAHLGVPLLENLKQAMLQRLPTLTDAEIIGYFTHLSAGFGRRHPDVKGFDVWVKAVVHEAISPERLRDISKRYSQGLLKIGPDDGWVLLSDLLIAAGGADGVHFRITENCVEATPEGLKLLGQLIAGPDLRLADMM